MAPQLEHRCLEYQYTTLGRQTHFGRWTPQYSRDALNASTQHLAEKHTLANGPPSNQAEMPWIPVHTTWQTNLLLLMDPPCWMAISHCYWHLLVKNGNWQIYAKICQQIYPPNASWDIYYGMYLAAILYSTRKGGNFLLFLNNWVVNSQLTLYSHVRYNPLKPPPKNTLKHPHMTITNFNYENSYLPCIICNIVVKGDLGRSPGRCTPTPKCIMGYRLWDNLATVLDSSRKGGNFLLFLNN